jgi:hypothetical protein
MAADLFRFHVTVSKRFLDKLEAARAARSHSHPGASAEAILEAGLDLVLAEHAKRKGLVARPRTPRPAPASPPSPPASADGEGGNGAPAMALALPPARDGRDGASRHVPAHVKRTVWARAGGRCEWPVASGGVCGSTLRLEFDHIQPRARGGPSTVENLRLACAVHNQFAARLVFGDAWMDRFSKEGRAR